MTQEIPEKDNLVKKTILASSKLLFKKLRCSKDLNIIHYTVSLHENLINSFNMLISCSICARQYDPVSDVFESEDSVPKDFNDHYLLIVDEFISLSGLLRTLVTKIKIYETDDSLVYRNGALDALRSVAYEYADSVSFHKLEEAVR